MNHWWQNWPKTHAYVAGTICFPTTVDELAAAVRLAETSSLPVRAVGGGWSFSDSSLPGATTTTRPDIATADRLAMLLPLAQGFAATATTPPAIDLTRPSVAVIDPTNGTLLGYDGRNRVVSTAAASASGLEVTLTGVQPKPVCLIDTRSLKSSLQATLHEILLPAAKASGKHYFHVEGGITIAEMGPLLDAQSPRLVLDASGGNPGATLAGSLATATHGAEQSTPLLVDRVKAVHLVGPGGLQWWIEGDDAIADVDALLARHPCLDRTRIITGLARVHGATPQDWLTAVVVSMGGVGAVYAVVLEVTPLTGVREVVSQTTWWNLLTVVRNLPVPVLASGKPVASVLQTLGLASENQLRIPTLNPGLSAAITMQVTSGSFSGRIAAGANTYSDLAFNPNRRADGDLDCWIVNRDTVPVPFDRQPPATGGMLDVIDAVFSAMADAFGGDVAALVQRLGRVYGFIDPVVGIIQALVNPLTPALHGILQAVVPGPGGVILGQLLASANPMPLASMVARITAASDTLDVALDAIAAPMTASQSCDLAQPFLTGFLASTLGTAKSNPGIALGTSVGAIGFPGTGLVGAGLEVAMPAAAAFNFIQTEILDRMNPQSPFFGYVSIRVCPPTRALLGMPQWTPSVMIEVVAFGDAWGRTFMTVLQTSIIAKILAGTLDATLHWGLENELLTSAALRAIPAFKRATPNLAENEANPGVPIDRVAAFTQIRDLIRRADGSNPTTLFRAFDNAFTTRLGL